MNLSNNRWRSAGSIQRSDKHEKVHIVDLSADHLVLKNEYVGSFRVTEDLSVNGSMFVNQQAQFADLVTFQQDVLAVGDVTITGNFIADASMYINTLSTDSNVNIGKDLYIQGNTFWCSDPVHHTAMNAVALYHTVDAVNDEAQMGINTSDPQGLLHVFRRYDDDVTPTTTTTTIYENNTLLLVEADDRHAMANVVLSKLGDQSIQFHTNGTTRNQSITFKPLGDGFQFIANSRSMFLQMDNVIAMESNTVIIGSDYATTNTNANTYNHTALTVVNARDVPDGYKTGGLHEFMVSDADADAGERIHALASFLATPSVQDDQNNASIAAVVQVGTMASSSSSLSHIHGLRITAGKIDQYGASASFSLCTPDLYNALSTVQQTSLHVLDNDTHPLWSARQFYANDGSGGSSSSSSSSGSIQRRWRHPVSMAINKPQPTEDAYVLDINGPLRITNESMRVLFRSWSTDANLRVISHPNTFEGLETSSSSSSQPPRWIGGDSYGYELVNGVNTNNGIYLLMDLYYTDGDHEFQEGSLTRVSATLRSEEDVFFNLSSFRRINRILANASTPTTVYLMEINRLYRGNYQSLTSSWSFTNITADSTQLISSYLDGVQHDTLANTLFVLVQKTNNDIVLQKCSSTGSFETISAAVSNLHDTSTIQCRVLYHQSSLAGHKTLVVASNTGIQFLYDFDGVAGSLTNQGGFFAMACSAFPHVIERGSGSSINTYTFLFALTSGSIVTRLYSATDGFSVVSEQIIQPSFFSPTLSSSLTLTHLLPVLSSTNQDVYTVAGFSGSGSGSGSNNYLYIASTEENATYANTAWNTFPWSSRFPLQYDAILACIPLSSIASIFLLVSSGSTQLGVLLYLPHWFVPHQSANLAASYDQTLTMEGHAKVDGRLYVTSTLDALASDDDNNNNNATRPNAAVVIDGGVCIAKNTHVHGSLRVFEDADAESALQVDGGATISQNVHIDGITHIQNTQDATLSSSLGNSGALRVSGGAQLQGNLIVSSSSGPHLYLGYGASYTTTEDADTAFQLFNQAGADISGNVIIRSSNTDAAFKVLNGGGANISGNLVVGSHVFIQSSEEALSSNNASGALVVKNGGGAQITGNAVVAKQLFVQSTQDATTADATTGAVIVSGGGLQVQQNIVGRQQIMVLGGSEATLSSTDTGALRVLNNGGAQITGNVVAGLSVLVKGTEEALSTDTTTGTLRVVNGGAQIAKNAVVGQQLFVKGTTAQTNSSTILGGAFQVPNGGMYVGGNAVMTGQVFVKYTDAGTAALTVDGGATVAKNAVFGSSMSITGTVMINSTVDANAADNNVASLVVVGGMQVQKNAFFLNRVLIRFYSGDDALKVGNGGMTVNTNVVVEGNNEATELSATTGCVRASGGGRFGKNLIVGGQVIITKSTDESTALLVRGGATIEKSVLITSTSAATVTAASNTGALQVTGGAQIRGNAILSGKVVAVSTNELVSDPAVQIEGGMVLRKNAFLQGNVTTVNGSALFLSVGDLAVDTDANITLTYTSAAVQLQSGGLYVEKNMAVRGQLAIQNSWRMVTSGTFQNGFAMYGNINFMSADVYLDNMFAVAASQYGNLYIGSRQPSALRNIFIGTVNPAPVGAVNGASIQLGSTNDTITIRAKTVVSSTDVVLDQLELQNTLTIRSGDNALPNTTNYGALKVVSGGATIGRNLVVAGQIIQNNTGGTSPAENAILTDGGITAAKNMTIHGTVFLNNHASIAGSLLVSGSALLRQNVRVDGSLFTNQAMGVQNELLVSGSVGIRNSIMVAGSILVCGSAHFNNAVMISGSLLECGVLMVNNSISVAGSMLVCGSAMINNQLSVVGSFATTTAGSVLLGGSTLVSNHMAVSGSLLVSGSVQFNTHAFVSGSLLVNGSTLMNNHVAIAGSLLLSGSALINNSVSITAGGSLLTCGSVLVNHSVSIAGSMAVGGSVLVSNSVAIGGSLLVSGSLMAAGPMVLSGTTLLNNSAAVAGSLLVSGSAVFASSMAVNGSMVVTGTALFSNSAAVAGSLLVSSSVLLNNQVAVAGSLFVSGSALINNSASVAGSLLVSSSVIIGGTTLMNNQVAVAGSLLVSGSTLINNSASIAGSVIISGTAVLNNQVAIAGSLLVSGSTLINSSASVAGSLAVTGPMTIGGTTSINNSVSIAGSLLLCGSSFINNSILVGGSLHVSGNALVGGGMTMSGTTLMNNHVAVAGSLLVCGSSQHTNGILIGGSLYVSGGNTLLGGNAVINNNMSVAGSLLVSGSSQYTSGILVGGSLYVSGNALMGGGITMSSTTLMNNHVAVAGSLLVCGSSFLNNHVSVNGSALFGSGVTIQGTTLANNHMSVNGSLLVSQSVLVNSSVQMNGSLLVSGSLHLVGGATVGGGGGGGGGGSLLCCGSAHINNSIMIGGSLLVCGPVQIASSLLVSGSVLVKSPFQCTGNVSLGNSGVDGSVLIRGSVSTRNGIEVAGSLLVSNEVYINSSATIQGSVTFGRFALFNGGGATFSSGGSILVQPCISINNSLLVTGGTTYINTPLVVENTAIFKQALNVEGSLTVNNSALITNALTVGGSLSVAAALGVTGSIFATGMAGILGNLAVTGAGSVNGSLLVNSIATVTGSVQMSSSAVIKGSLHVGQSMMVFGTTVLQSSMQVNGSILANGDTTVTGLWNASSHASVGGSLYIAGSALVNNNMIISNRLTVNDVFLTGTVNGTFIGGNIESISLLKFQNRLTPFPEDAVQVGHYDTEMYFISNSTKGCYSFQARDAVGGTSNNKIFAFPFAGVGDWNSLTTAGDSVLMASNASPNASTLTMTVWSDAPTGVRIQPNITTVRGSYSGLSLSGTGLVVTGSTLFVSGSAVVSGNVSCSATISAASFNATSDYRIKKNVRILSTNETAAMLVPCKYENELTQRSEFGFIAHKVQEIYPELVSGEKDGTQLQSINYLSIIPLLVNEVRILKEDVAKLHELCKNHGLF